MPQPLHQLGFSIVRVAGLAARRVLLDPGEAFLILRMAAWVSILSLFVRLFPLPKALRLVAGNYDPTQRVDEAAQTKLVRAADLLLGTDLLFFKPVCWKRAALLHRYMGSNGIKTRIVFGVRKNIQGGIEGHAWLESDGRAIFEPENPAYQPTYRYPSTDRTVFDLSLLSQPNR